MKKLAFLIVGVAVLTMAATKSDNIDSFTGTLVDTKCHTMMPEANAGNEHIVMKEGEKVKMPNCATACANQGIPVAILDKDGNQHVLAVPAGQLADHMAKETRIEGKKMSGVIIPEKIEVKDKSGWKEVKLATMM